MKKISIIILASVLSIVSFAQSLDDALLFSSNSYEGSARTMAMGNAFTALGGDIGALTINPASSGVMRSSQLSLTLGSANAKSKIDRIKDNFSSFSVPSFGYVASFETGNRHGLYNFNLGIAFNSRANFNALTSVGTDTDQASYLSSLATGLTGVNYADLSNDNPEYYYPYNNNLVTWPEVLAWNSYVLATTPDSETDYLASTENIYGTDIVIGGPLSQDYFRRRDGGINDMTLNLGGNFNDEIFVGVNVNISSVDYNLTESYAEAAINSDQFQDGFVRYALQYSQQTSGAGINAQFGIIYTPKSFEGLRLGATYTTKTKYTLSDTWRYFAQSDFNNGHSYSLDSPVGNYDYILSSPSRYTLGVAYTFESNGLVSLDYESVNYRDIRVKETSGNSFSFSDMNTDIQNQFNNSYVLRLGAEYWIDEFAIRGGEARYSASAQWAQAKKVHSIGAGWKLDKAFLFDVAYQWCSQDSDFQMYDNYIGGNVPTFVATNKLNKFMCTLTIKF